jgi:hypothetical protein
VRLDTTGRTADLQASAEPPISQEVTAIEHLVPGFAPETALERALAADGELLEGLAWGRPRPGHPEGPVGRHVADLLAGVTEPRGPRRRELRFMALVHDACKHRVRPEAGPVPLNDHALLARRLAERYTADERVLVALEHHDAPYRIWRRETGEDGRRALLHLLAGVPDLGLFLRFVELAGSTAGKHPGPLRWMRAPGRPAAPAAAAAA